MYAQNTSIIKCRTDSNTISYMYVNSCAYMNNATDGNNGWVVIGNTGTIHVYGYMIANLNHYSKYTNFRRTFDELQPFNSMQLIRTS